MVVNGQEVDILLGNAAIQMKSGGAAGATRQLANTIESTGLPTFLYGPKLGPHFMRSAEAAGGIVTRDRATLIKVVKP